jgi:hypothetical protein
MTQKSVKSAALHRPYPHRRGGRVAYWVRQASPASSAQAAREPASFLAFTFQPRRTSSKENDN